MFNTVVMELSNGVIITMTVGEWDNMKRELDRTILEEIGLRYGRVVDSETEPESGSL